jgi:hypothetical protein
MTDEEGFDFCTINREGSLSGIKRPECAAKHPPAFTAYVNSVYNNGDL